jgi:hypothetical protein
MVETVDVVVSAGISFFGVVEELLDDELLLDEEGNTVVLFLGLSLGAC